MQLPDLGKRVRQCLVQPAEQGQQACRSQVVVSRSMILFLQPTGRFTRSCPVWMLLVTMPRQHSDCIHKLSGRQGHDRLRERTWGLGKLEVECK